MCALSSNIEWCTPLLYWQCRPHVSYIAFALNVIASWCRWNSHNGVTQISYGQLNFHNDVIQFHISPDKTWSFVGVTMGIINDMGNSLWNIFPSKLSTWNELICSNHLLHQTMTLRRQWLSHSITKGYTVNKALQIFMEWSLLFWLSKYQNTKYPKGYYMQTDLWSCNAKHSLLPKLIII